MDGKGIVGSYAFRAKQLFASSHTSTSPVLTFVPKLFASATVYLMVALSGCTTWPQELPPNPTFKGIATLASGSNEPIRILFIHGMGIHTRSDPDVMLQHLTKAMGMKQTPPKSLAPPESDDPNPVFIRPAPILISIRGAPAPAELYKYDFISDDGKSSMSFSYFLWSPLTTSIKKDNLKEPEALSPALINGYGKTLINDNFSDAVIYAGTYRDVIRPALEEALCLFVDGTPDSIQPKKCTGGNEDIRTAVITHSLGGYMLIDAIHDLSGDDIDSPTIPFANNASLKVLSRLDLLYMLANQLPLLDLTTLTSYSTSPQLSNAASKVNKHNFILNRFFKHWDHQHHQEHVKLNSDKQESLLQLVALSDPNDVLSYVVSQDDIENPNVAFYNVFLPNAETDWFGILADPLVADTGYLSNDADMNVVVCGMTAGTINNCNNKSIQN